MTLRRDHLPLTVTIIAGVILVSGVALGGTFGIPDGDSATLIAILQNGVQTLAALNKELDTAKKSYQEVKRTAQYAQDAVNMAEGVISLNPDEVLHSVEPMFPAVQYFEMESRYPNSWTHGTGGLQALLSLCVSGAAHSAPGTTNPVQCQQVERQLDLQQTKQLIAANYGQSRKTQLEAADQEAARGFVASHAGLQRNRAVDAQAKLLMQQCSDTGNPAACQAAANAAAVMQLEQSAATQDQIALVARLQAIQIAQKNADLRREETDAAWREEQLRKSVDSLGAPGVRVKTDGFNILEDAP